MPYAAQGITVEPNGQTVVVAITELGGGTPTVYTDKTGVATVAMPATISARTTFFLADPATYTLSAKVGGTENANGSGGTASIDLTGRGIASIGVSAPVFSAASGSATFVSTLGLPNGTDDSTSINAVLTAARVAGGGLVKGLPGQTYLISAPLVIGSGTTLDMTGCTVRATVAVNLLNNYALTAARTVMDVAVTGASTTVTSATAAFVSGDVGATVWVWGGDVQGGIFRTTIASVTNGTTAVLTAAPVTTLAAATVSIGPRDRDFHVIGGTWDRGSLGGSGTTVHKIRLRRADQWTIRGAKVTATAGGKYGITPGDCTDFTVESITFNTDSDGVHVNGPAQRGLIRDIRGYTHDDMVSLTPNDWSPYNDCYGDISDIAIEDIRPWQSENTAVKVLGGSATPLTTARRIRVRNVSGYATNLDQSQGGLVWIGDDAGQSTTTGGRVDDVLVENVAGRCKATEELVLINGSNIGRVTLRNLSAEPTAGSAALTLVGTVWVKSGSVVESLTVDGLVMTSQALHSSGHVSVSNGATVTSLIVRNVQMKAAGTSNHLLNIAGTVTNLSLSDVYGVGSAASTYLLNLGTTAVVSDFLCDRVQIASGTGWKSPVSAPSAATLTNARFSNMVMTSNQFVFGEYGGTTRVYASNVRSSANPLWCSSASSNVQLYFENCDLGATISTTGGYTLAAKSFGVVCDVSFLSSKNTGDRATNTSNANTGTLGVGPAVYTGTAWKSLVSGNTF